MTLGLRLTLGAALASGACAPDTQHGAMSWVGQVGPDRVEGRVRVVGNEPFPYAVVQPVEGQPRIVTGPFKREIQRLAGAEVLVTGRLGQGELPDTTLEASSYEILSVDGDRPLVGELKSDDDGFYLAGNGGLVRRVGFVSETLAARVGSLVWVILDELDGVARYGIIREPV